MEVLLACEQAPAASWPAIFVALFAVFLTLDFGAAAFALSKNARTLPLKAS
jgi:hypothetical protein